MKPIRVDWRAREEMESATDYYNDQRDGLGDLFAEAIAESFGRIQRMPRIFPRFEGGEERRCLMRRFPYTIYFLELDEEIRVLAVAHQRRQLGYWTDRRSDDSGT